MITIRQAQLTDVPILQKLDQEVFEDNKQYDADLVMDWAITEPGEKYFTDIVTKPESISFIAYDENKPVGYIALTSQEASYRKSKYIEIENMGVTPIHRSHGIGSQLIQKGISWSKEQGFKRIGVNAYYHNNRAVAFYKKNGFDEIDVTLEQEIK